jgi:hypothetical protein
MIKNSYGEETKATEPKSDPRKEIEDKHSHGKTVY